MTAAATPPRELGLEFQVEDGVVTISAVDRGGEGEVVGLIVGDVVDRIDGFAGTVEESIDKLCDDSHELRPLVMRIRRAGVVLAVELFSAPAPNDGAEVADEIDQGERADASADAGFAPEDAVNVAVSLETLIAQSMLPPEERDPAMRSRHSPPIADHAVDDVAADAMPPLEPPPRPCDEETGRFGPRPHPPNCPESDRRFYESSGRTVSYSAQNPNYNPFALPDAPPPSHYWDHH
jgi:hypothetical protein